MQSPYDEFRPFVEELASLSGDVIRPYFDSDVQVERKQDASPVTRADREAEEVMRNAIARHYPRHGIIGEEFGTEREHAEYVWVLDPIDGTVSFVHGCALFGTLICLMHNGVPVIGAINQPVLRQFVLGDGETCTYNGAPTRMRDCPRLEDATLLTTDVKAVREYRSAAAFAGLMQRVRLFRGWGDCYGYLLLARGMADIMADPIMNLWDIAALVPVIRGAGGVITAWDGSDAVRGNSCIAAPANLHAHVLELLNNAEPAPV
jgi:histidinol phosphatase-like enzyme (inositol monophosphatase family)